MARLKGWVSEKQESKKVFRGNGWIVYESKKWGIVARRVNASLSPKQREVIESWAEWLRLANVLYKYTDAEIRQEYERQEAISGISARDIWMSAMNGLLLYFDENGTGRRIYSMAHRDRISRSLDVFSQEAGALLVRGQEVWEPLLPGGEGCVLVSQGPGKIPAWMDIGTAAGGGGPWVFYGIDMPRPPNPDRFTTFGLGDGFEKFGASCLWLGRVGNTTGNGWRLWLERVTGPCRVVAGIALLGWRGQDLNAGLVAFRQANSKFEAFGYYKGGIDLTKWVLPNTYAGSRVTADGHRDHWALISMEIFDSGFSVYYHSLLDIAGKVYAGTWDHTGGMPDWVGIGVRTIWAGPVVVAVWYYDKVAL